MVRTILSKNAFTTETKIEIIKYWIKEDNNNNEIIGKINVEISENFEENEIVGKIQSEDNNVNNSENNTEIFKRDMNENENSINEKENENIKINENIQLNENNINNEINISQNENYKENINNKISAFRTERRIRYTI